MIVAAAACSFCTAELEVDSSGPLSELLRTAKVNPGALEHGWRTVQTDDHEFVTVCPRCHVAFGRLVDAIDVGLEQALAARARLWPKDHR